MIIKLELSESELEIVRIKRRMREILGFFNVFERHYIWYFQELKLQAIIRIYHSFQNEYLNWRDRLFDEMDSIIIGEVEIEY